jgi:hut operon positive regulatory protein
MKCESIGKTSMAVAMAGPAEVGEYIEKAVRNGYRVCVGQAGSMDFRRIVAALETAAINEGLIGKSYWQKHALYHASLEAFHGVCRGDLELGSVLRTVGLRFAIVRGKRAVADADNDDWIAVALYGTIGAPIKGCEHEVVGLGINHI